MRSFLPKFSSKSEKRLLALCTNNPNNDPDINKWNKSAVQYLVKKLKKNPETIDELEKAISQECIYTKCVQIPKTSDNRLLVSHRKGLPQVIYCRLWRWPDLQSHHQIQAIASCGSSVEIVAGVEQPSRFQTVCVNPYHYERRKPETLDRVLVPQSRIPPDLSTSFEDSDPSRGTKTISIMEGLPSTSSGTAVAHSIHQPNCATILTQTELAHPHKFKQNKFAHLARSRHEHTKAVQHPSYDPHGYVTTPYSYTPQQQYLEYPQAQYQPQPQPQPSTSSYPKNPQQQYVDYPQAQYQPQPQTSTASYNQEPQQQYVEYPQQYQAQPQPQTSTASYTQNSHQHDQQYAQQTYYPQTGDQMQLDYQPDVPMGTQESMYYQLVAGTNPLLDQSAQHQQPIVLDFAEVPFSEGNCWCSISYHEYDHRVGEKYQPNSTICSVDGYTHPMCSDRFCIGGLSNVNRNQSTEWVRRRIGKGVKFTYIDGEVFVECLSDSSIFVSTPMLEMEEGKDRLDRVTKLPPGGSVKVFSNSQFSKLLSQAASEGFEAVYKLTAYCSFRVSFVKGWGQNYKRQTILNTPCWVEVQLNGPLQWIDKVLRQMRPPSQGCGSTS